MTATFVRFKNHAGWMVRGTTIMEEPPPLIHMFVAAYITAQIETGGKFGTVQSYDGAGMSAGLLHNVAVLPATMGQGDLWALLAAIRASGASLGGVGVHAAKKGWSMLPNGTLLGADFKAVSGEAIRLAFVGARDGNGSESYVEGKAWAEEFAALFSDPATFVPQITYAVRWLSQGQRQVEADVYSHFVRSLALPAPAYGLELAKMPRTMLQPELDLAMCVYHSFSANGPSPAATALRNAFNTHTDDQVGLARTLVRSLGTSDYGRWHDDPDDKGSRYDTTRMAIEKSGFWTADLVHEVMPRNL